MRAIQYQGQGSPHNVIKIKDLPTPTPGPAEILVKVIATVVTPTDTMSIHGGSKVLDFIKLFTGGVNIPGDVFAGEVVEMGSAVTKFEIGNRVFGSLAPRTGTHAEYLKINQDKLVTKAPSNLSMAECAALVDGPLTANAFWQKIAKLQPGQSVLINGASGSVGTTAVQLAKHFGAHVTGVCSTKNMQLVKSLGADHVIDYTTQDFTSLPSKFDFIFDTVNKSSFAATKKILKPQGKYMTTGPSLAIIGAYISTRFTAQKAVMGATGPFWQQAELEYIRDLAEQGVLQPIIDQTYTFTEIADAHIQVMDGHKVGSVIVSLES